MVQAMTLPSVTSVTAQEADAQTDVLAFITFEDDFPEPTDPLLRQVDLALGGNLRQASADERFRGKAGQSLVLHTAGALPARRLALMGAGSRASFPPAEAQHAVARLVRLASGVGARSLTLRSTWYGSGAEDELAWLEASARGALLGAYRFDKYLGEEGRRPSPLVSIHIARSNAIAASRAETALARGARVATAVANARDLVNEPAGTLTPAALARIASDRAKAAGVEATVLGPAECRARGMALFLAVSQGSAEEPRFIHLAWRPPALSGAEKPLKRVVLIGKGVTFDSGGLSLKTNDGMLGMKADMAGAAAVLNATILAAEEKLPVEVHALCACTENMPSGTSYKLGDVIRSMSGKTVEITNTDAEGRLTLADAMTYGLELKPDIVIDFATLTGACMVALGPYTAGVMTNDERLSEAWFAAARAAGEDMWPLPLPTRLKKQLKSEIADLRNTGERWGGALIAGLFLKEFVGSVPWVHVDIAGPATADKEWGVFGKGATGFGVASIIEYLRRIAPVPAG
jgi:leucyl aminopeptidase